MLINNLKPNITKNYIIYLDVIRICAIFLVLFNHTNGFHLFLVDDISECDRILYLFISIITKINVPLFFMISGALLLNKDEDFKVLLKKRILKFSLIILFFTFLLVLKNNLFHGLTFSSFISFLFSGSLRKTYWFLYSYLSFLIILPLLRLIAKSITKNHILYLLILRFICAIIISLVELLSKGVIYMNTNFQIPFVTVDCIFFSLIGYYLHNKNKEKIEIKKVLILSLVAVISIIICISVVKYEAAYFTYTQNYLKIFDFILAPIIFLFIKLLFDSFKPSLLLKQIICLIGNSIFGMYLFEPFTNGIITRIVQKLSLSTIFESILIVLLEMIISFFLFCILKSIFHLLKKFFYNLKGSSCI